MLEPEKVVRELITSEISHRNWGDWIQDDVDEHLSGQGTLAIETTSGQSTEHRPYPMTSYVIESCRKGTIIRGHINKADRCLFIWPGLVD